MSSPAAMVRIRNGRVEYLEPGNTYDVTLSVIKGPEAIEDYIDGGEKWAKKNAIGCRTSINVAEDDGCLLIDYDKRVVIFFGGDIECSYWQQQSTMEEIASAPFWNGWDVRWAYKGLLDVARYLDQVPELLGCPWYGKVDMEGCLLLEDAVTSDTHRAASVIAIKEDEKVNLYPLDTMFPEDMLHYGESNLASILSSQGACNGIHLDDFDLVRGFLIDKDAMTVTFWGLCCELVPRHLEEAWPGWKAIDLEGDRQAFECIVSSFMDPTEDK